MPTAYKGIGFVSPVPSGGIAHKLDTSTPFSNGKLLQVSNAGQEVLHLDAQGRLVVPSGLLNRMTVEDLLNVFGDIQIGGVRASQLLADLDAGLTGNPTETFARTSGAYQWIGGMWRPVPAGLVRAAHFIPSNGQLRRATLVEPPATNQAPEPCYFPASGSGWTMDSFAHVTPVPSIVEGQTAWRLTGGGSTPNIRRNVGTLAGSRDWLLVWLENVDATAVSVAITDQTTTAQVVWVDVNWTTMTTSLGTSPAGSGHIHGILDMGTGPNGGRLALVYASAVPNNPGNTRRLRPVYFPPNSSATLIIHCCNLITQDTVPGISPIPVGPGSRATDRLYTDSIPITSADTWTLYASATPFLVPGMSGVFTRVVDLAISLEHDRLRITYDGNTQKYYVGGVYGGYAFGASCRDPVAGAHTEFRLVNSRSDGKVYLGISINGDAEQVVSTPTGTPSPVAWRLSLGTAFDGSLGSPIAFHSVAIARGVRTLEEMRSGRGDIYEYRPGKGATTVYDLVHAGKRLGFFGTPPATRATVTGSKDGNAALASLIQALAGYGLIIDGTT